MNSLLETAPTMRYCSKCDETFSVRSAGMRARLRNCCTIEERFWMRTEKIESGCWIFQGCRDKWGYAQYGVQHKRHQAHRYAYTLAIGSIPEGMQVLHKCDVPACVNPDHLFLGSNAINMRDKALKGRAGKRLTLDQVREIKIALAAGRIAAEIARQYGVTGSLIGGIKSGRHYGYIT